HRCLRGRVVCEDGNDGVSCFHLVLFQARGPRGGALVGGFGFTGPGNPSISSSQGDNSRRRPRPGRPGIYSGGKGERSWSSRVNLSRTNYEAIFTSLPVLVRFFGMLFHATPPLTGPATVLRQALPLQPVGMAGERPGSGARRIAGTAGAA